MTVRLPEELNYLRPSVDRLARARREIDETYDTSEIMQALHERVRGLPPVKAQQRLIADRSMLEAWLARKGQHPAHFLIGLLSLVDDLGAVTRLVEHSLASGTALPKPKRVRRKRPFIEGLVGFQLDTASGGVTSYGSLEMVVIAMGMTLEEGRKRAEGFATIEYLKATPATFGEVSGWKYISNYHANSVSYILFAGGYSAQVEVQSHEGMPFDPSAVERCLSSLHFR